MFNSFKKTAIAAAVAFGAFTGLASAEDARIKHMSFSITVPYKSDITVTSSNGKRWDTILPKTVPLWVDIEVDTRLPGYVDRAGLYLGTCSKTGCGSNPRLLYWDKNSRDWSFHDDFKFDTTRIPVTTTGIATTNIGDAVLNACNAKLEGEEVPNEVISVGVPVTATLSVNTRKRVRTAFDASGTDPSTDPFNPPFNGGDVSKTTTFMMEVNCLPLSKAEAPPKPVSVDIRVAQKGNSCPKDAEVTAYIDYQKPMTGRFQVIHNGAPSETIEIKARKVSFAGKTWYRIERLERYELDPGKHEFQIKVIGGGQSPTRALDVDCPPFKVSSAWLAYKVEDKDTCPKQVVEEATIYGNRPGDAPYRVKTQGGLLVTQGTAHIVREGDKYVARATRKLTISAFDQMMQLEIVNDPAAGDQKPLKVECLEARSGKLTLQSLGASSCKGEALVAIRTNGAGELPYELECGPGKSWQRKVTAMANKIGVDKVQFDVANNEQVTCVLRTRIGGVLKPLDGASKTFQCHKTTDTGASTDLAPDTRPDPQKPDKPSIVVVDPPRPTIGCVNGVVRNGACECQSGYKPVKAGKNAFRCMKTVVIDPPRKPGEPKPDQVTVSQPKISCSGGIVRNGACTCARTHKPVKAGKNAWRCIKVVADAPRNKDKAKVEVTTAPKKTATPSNAKGNSGKGKTAKKGNGSSAVR